MKKCLHILLALFSLLLTVAGVGSCAFRELVMDAPTLNIYLFMEQQAYTKADVGPVSAISDAEKDIHSLQIWVFDHSTGEQIAYIEPDFHNDILKNGQEERYSTMIKRTVASQATAAGGLEVDVYVLANAESAGLTGANALGSGSTRDQLNAAVITAEKFGTSALTTGADIVSKGLPMSCVATKTMTGADLQFQIETVALTRAVSKVRFVFCQQEGSGITNFTLTGLRFREEMIPVSEYVFNNSGNPYKTSTDFVNDVTSFPVGGVTLPLCTDCSIYFKNVSQSAQDYETMLNNAVSANPPGLSQVGPFYFRESGKQIVGEIAYSYTFENTTHNKTVTFTMTDAGDFARNHSWIVYGYFIGERLNIYTCVKQWYPIKETTSFTQQIGINGEYKTMTGHMEWTWDGEGESRVKVDVNHYLSNRSELEGGTSNPNYYDKYYQIRQIDLNRPSDLDPAASWKPCIEVSFRPFAPLGGYWQLIPVEVIPGSLNKMRVSVFDGELENDQLMGQIMNTDVLIHITPTDDYNPATDESQYAIMLKCYFSPSISFDPEYNADSEFQDVHRDGRYSYWRFSLWKYTIPTPAETN